VGRRQDRAAPLFSGKYPNAGGRAGGGREQRKKAHPPVGRMGFLFPVAWRFLADPASRPASSIPWLLA